MKTSIITIAINVAMPASEQTCRIKKIIVYRSYVPPNEEAVNKRIEEFRRFNDSLEDLEIVWTQTQEFKV